MILSREIQGCVVADGAGDGRAAWSSWGLDVDVVTAITSNVVVAVLLATGDVTDARLVFVVGAAAVAEHSTALRFRLFARV